MEIFITIFYILFFCFIIYHLHFFEISSLSKSIVIGIFLLKVIAASSFGIIHFHFYGAIDTFMYFYDSKGIYQTLFDNQLHFLQLLFGPSDLGLNAPIPSHLLPYLDKYGITYWGHYYTSEYMVIRFLTIFNLFTSGYYYADAVFMAFISLIGLLYIYRILASVYSEKTFFIQIALFGIPSVVFFTSGIHKEALSVFFLGILLWNFHKISDRNITIKRLFLILASGLLLYIVREFIFIFLLPNLIAYYLCMKRRKNVFVKFLFTHLLYWLLVLNLFRINEQLDIIHKIVVKQEDFSSLKGNSNIKINKLDENIFSLVKNFHSALRNTLVYPLYWNAKNLFQKLASFESGILFLILAVCLLFMKIRKPNIHPILPFCIVFSFSLLILFGLIVPNLGAIARYKSVPLPFLVASFFIVFDEKRFLKKVKKLFGIAQTPSN